MKKITVRLEECTLRLDEWGKLHIEVFQGYGQHFSADFTDDVKDAFTAFMWLLSEREEQKN